MGYFMGFLLGIFVTLFTLLFIKGIRLISKEDLDEENSNGFEYENKRLLKKAISK